MSDPAPSRVAGIVVDFRAGEHLARAVDSMLADGIDDVVVVDNFGGGASRVALGDLGDRIVLVEPGRNLGMGAGTNRGLAAVGDAELVLVANPDVVLHGGATKALVAALEAHANWAIVGPTILTEAGATYPSVRRFPGPLDAVGHATLGKLFPHNAFTRRYREAGANEDGTADWVSGSCFLARRTALEALGGFDESYFMFAEDMDLCWRAWQQGFAVGVAPEAVVTHVEGVSRRSAARRMLVAHHVSALRFAWRTTRGPSRVLLPGAALLLGLRLCAGLVVFQVRGRRWGRRG